MLTVTAMLLLTPPSSAFVESPAFGQMTSKMPELKPKLDMPIALTTTVELPEPPKPPTIVVPAGGKYEWLRLAGIPETDWRYIDYIVNHESSWNPNATNVSSGAHGVCQSLPASKMASAGEDYMTNPVTQLRWCDGYAHSRYGSWASAYNFWTVHHWW